VHFFAAFCHILPVSCTSSETVGRKCADYVKKNQKCRFLDNNEVYFSQECREEDIKT